MNTTKSQLGINNIMYSQHAILNTHYYYPKKIEMQAQSYGHRIKNRLASDPGNFPRKHEVVHIHMLTSLNSWQDSRWVLTQQGTLRTGEEDVIDTLTRCCRNCSGGTITLLRERFSIGWEGNYVGAERFPSCTPKQPGNAHYRHLDTKEPIILSPFS